MKYMINVFEFINEVSTSIMTTVDDENFISFGAEIGNPNYDQFLASAKLTDEEVHALEPDVWFDFPVDGGTK